MTAIGPGTRVKCVREGTKWLEPHPKVGSVHTVVRVVRKTHYASTGEVFRLACEFLVLERWRHIYGSPNFVPLDGNEDISALENVLKIQSRAPEFTP